MFTLLRFLILISLVLLGVYFIFTGLEVDAPDWAQEDSSIDSYLIDSYESVVDD